MKLIILFVCFASCVSTFQVYWNVPSSSCNLYDIYFNLSQYHILQNHNDNFFGDQVVILYDPGMFPAFIFNRAQGKSLARNGGIPQLGNLTLHLEELTTLIEFRVPDVNFSGIGVLNMEFWRPLWRQNYVSNPSLAIYRDESIKLEKKRQKCWSAQRVEKQAERSFEVSARLFMEKTLELVKELRPKASWGYYSYPACFNYSPDHDFDCPPSAKKDNDELSWLFSGSSALFPSAYISTQDPSDYRDVIIRARVAEGHRVSGHTTSSRLQNNNMNSVLSYIRYRYANVETFLSMADLRASLHAPVTLRSRGLVIWGSSGDVNTRERCEKLHAYVSTTLGPAVYAAVNIYNKQ